MKGIPIAIKQWGLAFATGVLVFTGLYYFLSDSEFIKGDLRGPASVNSDLSKKYIELRSRDFQLSDKMSEFNFSGKCKSSKDTSAKVLWSIVKFDAGVDRKGESECKEGHFSFTVTGLDKLECEQKHQVNLTYQSSGHIFATHAKFSKLCPPEKRWPATTGHKENCFHELRSFTNSKECVKTCYQDNVLTQQKLVSRKLCSEKS